MVKEVSKTAPVRLFGVVYRRNASVIFFLYASSFLTHRHPKDKASPRE